VPRARPDRRRVDDPDYRGPERRSARERREEWALKRDQALLVAGLLGVFAITVAAITVGIKDSAVALAALTLFGGLLGAPSLLRLDEARERRRGDAP
jgi:hypothetical protein